MADDYLPNDLKTLDGTECESSKHFARSASQRGRKTAKGAAQTVNRWRRCGMDRNRGMDAFLLRISRRAAADRISPDGCGHLVYGGSTASESGANDA